MSHRHGQALFACAPCHRGRCTRLCPTPIVHRRFTSPVAVGLTICHAPIFDEKQSLTRPTAASGPLGLSSGLAACLCGPIICTAHLPSPVKRVLLCYILPFLHFQLPSAPLLSVDRRHPAPTTAFSGRSTISSSANAECTTVGPT